MKSTFSELCKEHSKRLNEIYSSYKDLCQFIGQLPVPNDTKSHITTELTRIITTINNSNTKLLDTIKSSFDDLSLNINYMAFDLAATKKEKEQLERKLKDKEN